MDDFAGAVKRAGGGGGGGGGGSRRGEAGRESRRAGRAPAAPAPGVASSVVPAAALSLIAAAPAPAPAVAALPAPGFAAGALAFESAPAPPVPPAAAGASAGAGAGAGAADEGADASSPEGIKRNLRNVFASYMVGFVVAVADVWTRDRVLADWRRRLLDGVGGEGPERDAFCHALVTGFHAVMKAYYQQISDKDATMLDDDRNAWFGAVRARAKFHASTRDIQATLWEHANLLARAANMYALYAQCPAAMLRHIQAMSEMMRRRVASGEMAAGDITPLMIAGYLKEAMTREEMERLGTSVLNDEALEGMLTLLMAQVNATAAEAGGDGAGWNLDLSSLLSAARTGDDASMPPLESIFRPRAAGGGGGGGR